MQSEAQQQGHNTHSPSGTIMQKKMERTCAVVQPHECYVLYLKKAIYSFLALTPISVPSSLPLHGFLQVFTIYRFDSINKT